MARRSCLQQTRASRRPLVHAIRRSSSADSTAYVSENAHFFSLPRVISEAVGPNQGVGVGSDWMCMFVILRALALHAQQPIAEACVTLVRCRRSDARGRCRRWSCLKASATGILTSHRHRPRCRPVLHASPPSAEAQRAAV